MVRTGRGFIAALGALLLALLLVVEARADVLPPGLRGVEYVLKIDNLDAYPEHAFIVYPTTNSGFGYVVETSPVNVIRLMRRKDWKGPASRLYAMTKAELAAHDPDAPRPPHADDRKTPVMVVDEPPKSALRADAAIEPPDLVPHDSDVIRIERTFHIAKLDPNAFELELVEEKTVDGAGQEEVTRPAEKEVAAEADPPEAAAPAPASTPESKSCRIGSGSEAGGGLWLLALLALLRRRVRS